MLTSQEITGDAEFAQIIHLLLREDNQYFLSERRSLHRETLVRPVELAHHLQNAEVQVIYGITRNISPAGVCILTLKPIQQEQLMTIKIYRLNGSPVTFLADCRWSKPFTEIGFMSGWEFRQLMRS